MFDLEATVTEIIQTIQAYISELSDWTIKRTDKGNYSIIGSYNNRLTGIINIEFESYKVDSEQVKVFINQEIIDNSLGYLLVIIPAFTLLLYGIVFTVTGNLTLNELFYIIFLILGCVALGVILKIFNDNCNNNVTRMKDRIIKTISAYPYFMIIESFSNKSLGDQKYNKKPSLSQIQPRQNQKLMIKCPKCEHSNPQSNIFCDSCGYHLQ